MEQINRIRKKPLSDAELQIVRQMEADSRLANQPADLALETAIQQEGKILAEILEQAIPVVDDTASLERNIAALQEKFPDAAITGKTIRTRPIVMTTTIEQAQELQEQPGEYVELANETEITIEVPSGKVVLKVTPPDFPADAISTQTVIV